MTYKQLLKAYAKAEKDLRALMYDKSKWDEWQATHSLRDSLYLEIMKRKQEGTAN